jgi:hypothetical protein
MKHFICTYLTSCVAGFALGGVIGHLIVTVENNRKIAAVFELMDQRLRALEQVQGAE